MITTKRNLIAVIAWSIYFLMMSACLPDNTDIITPTQTITLPPVSTLTITPTLVPTLTEIPTLPATLVSVTSENT